jgi:hypothetical protein
MMMMVVVVMMKDEISGLRPDWSKICWSKWFTVGAISVRK